MNLPLDTWKAQATKIVDVRPDLERGDEPFVGIYGSRGSDSRRRDLAIIAPFEPVPLYGVLGERGSSHETRQ